MSLVDNILKQKIADLKEHGNYRYFLEVNKSAQHFPLFYYQNTEGIQRSAVNWCSNDYLCMSTEEEVISRLSFTMHRSGTGSSGTRNISGTTLHHRELEKKLADWHKKENALLFNGAYQANVTTLQTLGKHIPELVFISDERNHASLIEGMRAAGNPKLIFRHNDVSHLEEILQSLPIDQPKIIVFESVYSITGNIAPIRNITSLTKKFNAISYVDEVHAVGLYGKDGSGMIASLELQNDVDIINGTLSKAIGVFGGYIAASGLMIDFIRSFGSGFIFTTSLPPAVCSAASKSIELISKNAEWRQQLQDNVCLLRTALNQHGIKYYENESHITSVKVGDSRRCKEVADLLLSRQGIYLQPINAPTVPVGEECLRIVITRKHQLKHINHLAHSLQKILHEKDQAYRPELEVVFAAD
jgi:5-aminolevulinate synthase